MLKKVFILFLVQAFILSHSLSYAAESLSLDTLVAEARLNNPEILAARKRYEAAKARIPQAKSLDDPQIGLTFEKTKGSPFQFSKTASEDRMLTFAQFFPLFGKLSLKGKIALAESQMAAGAYKDKELEIVNKVRNAYYDLFMNYKESQLSQESLQLLEEIAKVSEARYSLAEITQEDVYKIHSELASLNNKILNLQEEKRYKETRLNVLLNRDPESPIGAPYIKEEAEFNKDLNSLYRLTLENQPELLIFSYAIEKNKFAKSLAKRNFLPDVMSGIVMRGITAGTIGPWDLMLAFSVPLWFWTKQRYALKEAIANVEEAEAAYKSMQNMAFGTVKDLVTKIEISKNKLNLYKTSLIPILEGSIESSLAAFRSGKGDFMMLLDSQRMLIEARMGYYKALVEYNMYLADLERTAGVNLE